MRGSLTVPVTTTSGEPSDETYSTLRTHGLGAVNQPEALALPPAKPQPASPEPPSQRVFSDRTTREFFALYEGRTMLQAEQLIAPFKEKWIEAQGKILQLIPDSLGGSTAVLQDDPHLIGCAIGRSWNARLLKLNTGEVLSVIGKIGPSQNGQMLYLMECLK